MAARRSLTLEEFYDHPDVEDIIAAWEIEQERCPHHHGPRSECPESDRDWFPQRVICWPEAQLQAAMRMLSELHTEKSGRVFHDGTFENWAKEFDPGHPFRFDDGTRFFIARDELAGWDEWTTDPNASPERPADWGESVAEQSPEKQGDAE